MLPFGDAGSVTVIGCGLIGGSLIKALRAEARLLGSCGVDATHSSLDGARSYLDDCVRHRIRQSNDPRRDIGLGGTRDAISAIIGTWLVLEAFKPRGG